MTPKPLKPPLLIGVTGPIGSGVTTVAGVLKDMDFRHYKLSDTISREWVATGQGAAVPVGPDRRRVLQDFGNQMRREHGPQYWLEKTLADDPADQPIVVDGIRNLAEVNWLRGLYPTSFVIAVIAMRDVRWGRLRETTYQGDESRFRRDDERDWDLEEKENCGQQVQKCVLASDFVFVNNEHLGAGTSYRNKLKDALAPSIKMMRGESTRRPSPDEVHMATAYSQSHGSACLKRHVGAVIVDQHGVPLSLGYNENPIGMLPCVHEYGFCFKDNDMEEKMERMADVRCRGCGHISPRLSPPWQCPECKKDMKRDLFPSRNLEVCTALHAEERAIRSLPGRVAKDATMYVTTFPCFQCARYIIDAGIKRVVYVEAYPVKESIDFLEKHNVSVEAFTGFKARAFNLMFRGVE